MYAEWYVCMCVHMWYMTSRGGVDVRKYEEHTLPVKNNSSPVYMVYAGLWFTQTVPDL